MDQENKSGYKKTKIGWIPEDWKLLKLDTVCSIIQDGTHFSPKIVENGKFKYITSRNIRDGKIELNDVSYISQQSHDKIYKRCPVKFGDILLTKDGANTGTVCLNSLDEEFSILSSIAMLRANPIQTNNKYLYFLIQSPSGQKIIKEEIAGQAITRITLNTIKNFYFAFASLSEQHKIAQILTTWDNTIEITQKLITAKEQQKKALMQQLLTGHKRFGEYNSNNWCEVKLGDVFNERNETNFPDLKLLAITSSNGIVDRDSVEKRDTSNQDKSKYKKICLGDIGYNTMRLWQGVAGLSKMEGIVSPAYTVVTPTDKIDGLFMSYLFKLPEVIHLFYRHSQGLVNDTLNCKYHHFSQVKVTIPKSKKEQQKIASVLQTANKEIGLLKKKLKKLQQQKKGLMQVLLTGKIRVKIDEGKN